MSFRVQNLKKTYGKKVVVKNISFSVEKGSVLGLLGPNGAGKTTSFYMSIGLVKPDKGHGEIFIDGKKIENMSLEKAFDNRIGYLQQDGAIFRDMSVEENIICALESKDLSKKNNFDKTITNLLNEFGLEKLRFSLAKHLSGGEKRKLEIARLVACNYNYVLLDEPFAGIDPVAISSIRDMIVNLKQKGMGILITDHNAQEVCKISDKMVVILGGSCVASGKVEDVVKNKDVKEKYLGHDFMLSK